MIFPEVDRLYKYQSYNMHSVASLVNRVSWAAKPSTFNDPFDCAVSLVPEIDQDSLFELIFQEAYTNGIEGYSKDKIDAFKHQYDSGNFNSIKDPDLEGLCQTLAKRLAELIRDIGVVSLSEVNDHILMWSHYADQHRGFCVEFVRNDSNKLGSNSTLPVRYTEKLPVFSLQTVVKCESEERKNYVRSLVLSKAFEWSYEREWRYLNSHGNCNVDLCSEISAIIFGARMPEEHKVLIKNLVGKEYTSVKFRQVQLKQDGFGLEIVDYIPSAPRTLKDNKKRKFEYLLDFDL